MKKFVFVFLCFLVPSISFAITDFSVIGGVNQSDFKVSPVSGATKAAITPSTSMNGGLLIGWGSMIGLETGLIYTMKKYESFSRVITIRTNVKSNLEATYIQLPVVFRVTPFSLLTFGVGGYFGYLLSDSASGTAQVDNGPSITVAGVTTGLAKTDYGATGLLRLNLVNLATWKLFVEGRYNYGLADVDKSGGKANARDIQAHVGVMFNLGK